MDELFMNYFHISSDQMTSATPLGRTGRPEDVACAGQRVSHGG